MSILAWIVFGIVAGFIASRMVDGGRRGVLRDMVLGIFGAMVGGSAFHFIGQPGVTGFNLWSLFVAVSGAVLVLFAYHALFPRWGRRGD